MHRERTVGLLGEMERLLPNTLPSICFSATLALGMAFAACVERNNLECESNDVCDLASGGVCSDPGTGHGWCSYPDTTCPSGYRYSDVQVGDGVSGTCLPPAPDKASCASLAATCGPTGDDNCCNSPEVPGGTFYRGYDTNGDGDMSAPASVDTFLLDKYEVTVGRFRAFVEAGQGTQGAPPVLGSGAHPNIPESGWQAAWNMSLPLDKATLEQNLKCTSTQASQIVTWSWTDVAGANENRPINCVSWAEAAAFCAWDGGFLPTEAEWNYAAAGGPEQRPYPWSSAVPGPQTLDSDHASYASRNPDTAEAECLGDGSPTCDYHDLVVVGSKPAGDGRWGHSDMAGNVAEWTLDTFAPFVASCTNCANLTYGNSVTSHGGDFFSVSRSELLTGSRAMGDRGSAQMLNGIRCARPKR